jgi:hypothetical protein
MTLFDIIGHVITNYEFLGERKMYFNLNETNNGVYVFMQFEPDDSDYIVVFIDGEFEIKDCYFSTLEKWIGPPPRGILRVTSSYLPFDVEDDNCFHVLNGQNCESEILAFIHDDVWSDKFDEKYRRRTICENFYKISEFIIRLFFN